ncbi:helix-turn-helix domain-containing protein [Alistipes finegoldii]|uniref:helix-turn-helix domain-containing protein n=1 Tax=Alistipes finegoldii TaxID=214856 RepID=UPI0030804BDA
MCRKLGISKRTLQAYRVAGRLPFSNLGGKFYYREQDVADYLHISVRTLQTLRDTRKIPFTVVGERTILYPEVGVREILTKNYRPAEDQF